jgi:hypothetical protein
MSTKFSFTKQPLRANCPQLSRVQKAAMALVAVLVSCTLLGSVLSLFELRSEETAVAQAPGKSQRATDELAARNVDSRPRG